MLLQEQAKKEGVNLGAVRSLPVTAKYVELMKSWQEKPYPALATALWGIEYSYYKASSQYVSIAAKFDSQKCLNLFKSKIVTYKFCTSGCKGMCRSELHSCHENDVHGLRHGRRLLR